MFDALAKFVRLVFVFWIHMLAGVAFVFALAWLVIELVWAVFSQGSP